ncbi:MAG: dynamin family protein [Ruminococcus flavefaciens]
MKYLQDAINLLQDSGFVKEADILTAQYDNLQNEEFIITIVGEFSTGKSYLLNALIGDRLLPSYSDEATAAICFLRHKEKAKKW